MKMLKYALFVKKCLKINMLKYLKVRNSCVYTGGYRRDEHSICNSSYSVPVETPMAFHNESNYNYHFMIK